MCSKRCGAISLDSAPSTGKTKRLKSMTMSPCKVRNLMTTLSIVKKSVKLKLRNDKRDGSGNCENAKNYFAVFCSGRNVRTTFNKKTMLLRSLRSDIF